MIALIKKYWNAGWPPRIPPEKKSRGYKRTLMYQPPRGWVWKIVPPKPDA